MWYVWDAVYVSVRCFVVRGCAVWRRYINVCKYDMFSVLNVYLDHLKLCVVCTDGQRYVCCSECNDPTSCLVQFIGTHGGGLLTGLPHSTPYISSLSLHHFSSSHVDTI